MNVNKKVIRDRRSIWSGRLRSELSIIDEHINDEERFPPEDPEAYSLKYVRMAREGSWTPVTNEEIYSFRTNAIQKLCALAEKDPDLDEAEAVAGFEGLWPTLKQMLKERPFYAWIKEFGMDSAFIYPYFTVLSGKAGGLELAHGCSWDVTGRYREVPECDAAYYFRVGEPTFRSFVQRVWFSQQKILKRAMELGWALLPNGELMSGARKVRLLLLGGGFMRQLWTYDLTLEKALEIFDVTVYDNDPEMAKWLKDIFGKPIEEIEGIDYHFEDFHNVSDENEYDAVLCTGVMSYYTEPAETARILSVVKRAAVKDAVFVCDRQIFEPSMARCVFVLQWRNTSMKPDPKPEVAIEKMTQCVLNAGGFRDLDYEIDEYNEDPAIVNFAMRVA